MKARRAVVAGLVALVLPPAAPAAAPLPFPVAVEVTEERPVTAAGSRELLLEEVLDALREDGCAPHPTRYARATAPAAGALLRIVLRDVLEDVRWNAHTSERANAAQSGQEPPRTTTQVTVEGQIQVLALPGETAVRWRDFMVRVDWSPRTPGGIDDEARQRAAERIAAEARRTLCRSARRLGAELEAARRSSSTPSH
jgi:hypothetical protein